MSDTATATPSIFTRIWDRRVALGAIAGVLLGVACPYFPTVAGPCKILATVLRSWSFDGQPLP